MSSISKADRKALLNNPVQAYKEQCSQNDPATIASIEQLKEELSALKQCIKHLDNDKKGLSRRIGEAKSAGESIESLKQQVQAISRELKQLKESHKSLEDQIVAIFFSEQESAPDSKDKEIQRYPLASIDADSIQIALLQEHTDDWDEYVIRNPSTSVYHLSRWRRLIQKTFGHESYYLYATDQHQKLIGILPLIRLKSHLFGDFLVSMPYFNYGGAIGDHPLIEEKLIHEANQLAEKLGVSHIEYRDDISRAGMPVRAEKVNMLLSLPESIDTLWESFTPKVRAQIRRPQREDPDIRIGKLDCLDDFYEVFSRNMRDLGTPVYGRYFFEAILNEFEPYCWIVSVRIQGKPVAAGFLMGFRDRLEIPWASSRQDMNHLSVNMLLYWSVLQHAIKEGFRTFDFGRSSVDSGTYRFKRQWGAEARQSYWHYWLRDGEAMPALNPSNAKYALMINTWKRLPIALTRLIGPPIVKNIP